MEQEYPAGKKAATAWMGADWAMQPFHTLIVSFIFAPYFASTVMGDGVAGQEVWGRWAAISGIMTALTAPLMSSIAERSGFRKRWLLGLMIIFAVSSCALWQAVPGSGETLIVMWGFILAYMTIELSFVLTNAMLPSVAQGPALGRLSGLAWGIGYISGLLLLFVILLVLQPGENGLTLAGLEPPFGITTENGAAERLTGPLSALWYVVFMVPFLLLVPDKKTGMKIGPALGAGLTAFKAAAGTAWVRRGYRYFMISSMLYRDALAGLFVFGGIYARNVLGWSTTELGLFGILAGFTGIFGAIIGGRLDARFGSRAVINVSLYGLTFVTALALTTNATHVVFIPVEEGSGLPSLMFYLAGGLLGAFGGSLQSASRAYVVPHAQGVLTIGDAYGIYALSGRATAFIVPSLIALATGISGSAQIGATPLLVLFIIALVVFTWAKPESTA